MNREDREKRKISAPPTLETPDRRTSFMNSSSNLGFKGDLNDNSRELPLHNDNEYSHCLPTVIAEQEESILGKDGT